MTDQPATDQQTVREWGIHWTATTGGHSTVDNYGPDEDTARRMAARYGFAAVELVHRDVICGPWTVEAG